MVSGRTAVAHIRSWVRVPVELLKNFFVLSVAWFLGKNFCTHTFSSFSCPLVQHFLITSVFIGLFQANLAAVPELGSHSCEVPMVFIKITVLARAVVCLWWRWKHRLFCLPALWVPAWLWAQCACLASQETSEGSQKNWGPFGGPARKKREVDACLLW